MYIFTLSKPAVDNILFFHYIFQKKKKINFGISFKLSARQNIHMKCKSLFSLKIKKSHLLQLGFKGLIYF